MTFLATVTVAADNNTVRNLDAPAVAGVRVDLKNADGTVVDSRSGTDLTFTFPGLAAGSYSVDAYTFDTTGGIVGSVATASFTAEVPEPATTTVKTVSAVSVAVTAE